MRPLRLVTKGKKVFLKHGKKEHLLKGIAHDTPKDVLQKIHATILKNFLKKLRGKEKKKKERAFKRQRAKHKGQTPPEIKQVDNEAQSMAKVLSDFNSRAFNPSFIASRRARDQGINQPVTVNVNNEQKALPAPPAVPQIEAAPELRAPEDFPMIIDAPVSPTNSVPSIRGSDDEKAVSNIAVQRPSKEQIVAAINVRLNWSQYKLAAEMVNAAGMPRKNTKLKTSEAALTTMSINDLYRINGRLSDDKIGNADTVYDYFLNLQGGQGKDKKTTFIKRDFTGLFSDQINYMMRNYVDKGYLGCISADHIDMLKPGKHKKFGFIMNLDPSTMSGSHWIGVYVDFTPESGSICYYDSFAEPPDGNFIEGIKKLLDNRFWKMKLKYNSVLHQDNDSALCGFHAISFLVKMLEGKSFAEATGYSTVDKTDVFESSVEELAEKSFPYI